MVVVPLLPSKGGLWLGPYARAASENIAILSISLHCSETCPYITNELNCASRHYSLATELWQRSNCYEGAYAYVLLLRIS